MTVLSKLKSVIHSDGSGGEGDEVNKTCSTLSQLSMNSSGGGNGSEMPKASSSTTTAPFTAILANALKYLSHDDLQKCRFVSAGWNNFISSSSKVFVQRPQFVNLNIARHDQREVKIEGSESSLKWLDLPAFKSCCQDELKPIAKKMVGEVMDPSVDPNDFYQLIAYKKLKGRLIRLIVRNKLNAVSAFHFLHFLKHLSGYTIGEAALLQATCPPIPVEFRYAILCDRLMISGLKHFPQLEYMLNIFPSRRAECMLPFVVMEQALGYIANIAAAGRLPCSIIPRLVTVDQRQFRAGFKYFRDHDLRSTLGGVLLDLCPYTNDTSWTRWPLAPFHPPDATKLKKFDCMGHCEHYSFSYPHHRETKEPYAVVVHVEANKVMQVEFVFSK